MAENVPNSGHVTARINFGTFSKNTARISYCFPTLRGTAQSICLGGIDSHIIPELLCIAWSIFLYNKCTILFYFYLMGQLGRILPPFVWMVQNSLEYYLSVNWQVPITTMSYVFPLMFVILAMKLSASLLQQSPCHCCLYKGRPKKQ